MLYDDQEILASYERLFCALENESRILKDIRSIHAEIIRQMGQEIRSYARIFEEISLPARFILEHILELKHKGGQMALEAENISQHFSAITEVRVEEFGIIKISTGSVQLSWRDEFYNYLLYPDKVELRTTDEKTAIKLFFSHAFGSQGIQKFRNLNTSSRLLYLHPVLQNYTDPKEDDFE